MRLIQTFTEVLGTAGAQYILCAGILFIFVGLFVPIYNKLYIKKLAHPVRTSIFSILMGCVAVIIAGLLCLFFNNGLAAFVMQLRNSLPIAGGCIWFFIFVCVCWYIIVLYFGTGEGDKKEPADEQENSM